MKRLQIFSIIAGLVKGSVSPQQQNERGEKPNRLVLQLRIPLEEQNVLTQASPDLVQHWSVKNWISLVLFHNYTDNTMHISDLPNLEEKNKKPPSFFLIFLKVCAPSSAVCSGLAKSADHHNYWINNVITAVTVPPWMLSDHDCRAVSSAFSSLDTRCSSTKLLRFFRRDSGGFLSKILTVLWSTIKAASHSQYEHFAHIVRMKIGHMWILGCVLARVWR